jgi:20S proteasome subunit beta 6
MYIPTNDMLKHFKGSDPTMANITHKSDQWSPYNDNSGTVIGIIVINYKLWESRVQ